MKIPLKTYEIPLDTTISKKNHHQITQKIDGIRRIRQTFQGRKCDASWSASGELLGQIHILPAQQADAEARSSRSCSGVEKGLAMLNHHLFCGFSHEKWIEMVFFSIVNCGLLIRGVLLQ